MNCSSANGTESRSPDALKPFSILIVDDETGICDFLQRALSKRYSHIETAHCTQQAADCINEQHYDLLLVDICMPGRTGIEWLKQQGVAPQAAVIFMTGFAELDNAVDAVRLGASDFIAKPFRLEQMLASVERCYQQQQLRRDNFLLRRQLQGLDDNGSMVGNSTAMTDVRALIERVAPVPSAVLIDGETGTGKELVAEALHRQSGRKGAFVPLNCAAIAPELIESELFGHSRGAFTGASENRDGLFRYADGGTLFLDEVADLPMAVQARLLRVLEEGRVRPVGREQSLAVDVRIIAACNVALADEVEAGRFRQDLFYRLNVLPISLPPLRQRREDIPALVEHLGVQLARQLNLPPLPMETADLLALQQYHWPGNIRELRNLLERAMLLGQRPAALMPAAGADAPDGYPLDWSLEQIEQQHLHQVLKAHQGNKSRAAEILGISRKTLDRKLVRERDAIH